MARFRVPPVCSHCALAQPPPRSQPAGNLEVAADDLHHRHRSSKPHPVMQDPPKFGVCKGSEGVGQVDLEKPHWLPYFAVFSAIRCAIRMWASALPPCTTPSATSHMGCNASACSWRTGLETHACNGADGTTGRWASTPMDLIQARRSHGRSAKPPDEGHRAPAAPPEQLSQWRRQVLP